MTYADTDRNMRLRLIIQGAGPWYSEAKVQSIVGYWLLSREWTLLHVSNTKARERGPDLLARREGRLLTVEAKGWPQRCKNSSPSSVASVNWARAFAKAASIRVENPDMDVAIALPAMKFYEATVAQLAPALCQLKIAVYLVSETHGVSVAVTA